jgi:hypothetical protein
VFLYSRCLVKTLVFLSSWCVLGAQANSQLDAQLTSEINQDTTSQTPVRRFNDVLSDLLNEFSYDLKEKTVPALKQVSIRKVVVSESIPRTYETYIESLVVERLKKYGQIKVIACGTCRSKKTILDAGKVTISTPVNNQLELDKLAEQLDIETWIDVALLYQESGMLLGVNAFDSKTKELVWTKVYNSENLYKQVVEGEVVDRTPNTPEEKKPEISKFALVLNAGWSLFPNVKKKSNMLNAGIRLTEVFNSGHSEVGALVQGVFDPGLFIKNYEGVEGDISASGEVLVGSKKETIKPFPFGLGLYALYGHNFFSGLENLDGFRINSQLGGGVIAAKGFFTFAARGGLGLKFGRSFLLEAAAIYAAPTTLRIKGTYEFKTKGGVGSEITFGYSF